MPNASDAYLGRVVLSVAVLLLSAACNAAQSIIDVRDIAEITATILTSDGHKNKAYDLTGPEALTFHDVARILTEKFGGEVTYVPVTTEAAEAAMKEQGMPAWSAHALAEIQDLFATGAYGDPLPDAERLLSRKLRSFRTFAKDYVGEFQNGYVT